MEWKRREINISQKSAPVLAPTRVTHCGNMSTGSAAEVSTSGFFLDSFTVGEIEQAHWRVSK